MTDGLNVTTEQFLNAIFVDVPDDEAVCVSLKREGPWLQVRPDHKRFQQPGPWYFCVSTVADTGKTTLRRRAIDFRCAYAVVLDDIGTKIPESKVLATGLAPSWVMETSPGNKQYGYCIDPTTDGDLFEALMTALGDAKFTDPKTTDRTRVMRVPGSINDKYAEPFAARLLEWLPETDYTIEEMISGFRLPSLEIVKKNFSAMGKRAESDPVFDWLLEEGLVIQDKGEWVDIICPLADTHTDPRPDAGYRPKDVDGSVAFKCWHTCKMNTPEFLNWVEDQGGPANAQRERPDAVAQLAQAIGDMLPDLEPPHNYATFMDAMPKMKVGALPDLKMGTKAPRSSQSTTTRNVRYVIDTLGHAVRFNMMSGEPELSPPEGAREGWYDEASPETQRRASIDSVVDWCLKLDMGNVNAMHDCITTIAGEHPYHPMEDWVLESEWDGVSRFDELLATIELTHKKRDKEIARVYLRKWMIQVMEAVRGYEYERMKDTVLVFSGPQGCGKTTWITNLLPEGMIAHGVNLKLDGSSSQVKDSLQQALCAPIVELGELDATFTQTDISALKSFLSQTVDRYRPAYARHPITRNRCTVFAGSVNDEQFLRDMTGNRRYLTLSVVELDGFHDINLQQLWAEVNTWWVAGESFVLTTDEQKLQRELNLAHAETSEPEDCFWEYFGPILAGTGDAKTVAVAATATSIAKIIGCRSDRPSLGAVTRLLNQNYGDRKRQLAGVRRAWLVRINERSCVEMLARHDIGLRLAVTDGD